jgi:hypothetical protein
MFLRRKHRGPPIATGRPVRPRSRANDHAVAFDRRAVAFDVHALPPASREVAISRKSDASKVGRISHSRGHVIIPVERESWSAERERRRSERKSQIAARESQIAGRERQIARRERRIGARESRIAARQRRLGGQETS